MRHVIYMLFMQWYSLTSLLEFDTAVFYKVFSHNNLHHPRNNGRGVCTDPRKMSRIASTGNMYLSLGLMMYNSAEILLAHKIAQENWLEDHQDRNKVEDEKTARLVEKAGQAYLRFKDLS